MTFERFHNALRIMLSIDMSELVAAGVIAGGDKTSWEKFRDNPYRWMLRVDDDTAQRLWLLIESRQRR